MGMAGLNSHRFRPTTTNLHCYFATILCCAMATRVAMQKTECPDSSKFTPQKRESSEICTI